MPVTYNLAQIDEAVQYIIKNAKNNVLLFYGEMGAGKTTLIKALVKALGSEDKVSSPTFSLVNEYHTPQEPIYHFDFYNLQTFFLPGYNFPVTFHLHLYFYCTVVILLLNEARVIYIAIMVH